MDRDDELKLKFSALHILLFLKKTSLFKKMSHKCCGKTASIYTLAHRHCIYVSPFNTHENLTLVICVGESSLGGVNLT